LEPAGRERSGGLASRVGHFLYRFGVCPASGGFWSCCGGTDFESQGVLWPKLVREWRLSPSEAAYIDRQQGTACLGCHSSLGAFARRQPTGGARTQRCGKPEVVLAPTPRPCRKVVSRGRHAGHAVRRRCFRPRGSFRHTRARARSCARTLRMSPGVAIWRCLLLHCARRRRADVPLTDRPAAELSRRTSRENGRLPCGNRVWC
jgi:hypothetical protein